MNHLTVFPVDLAALSVRQLANLSVGQLHEASAHLDEALDWLKKARSKLDAALEERFGEALRSALRESHRDFGTTHLTERGFRVTFELPKRVHWDQKRLAEVAERIVASGEPVEDYLDIKLSVPESRYNNWPPALKAQFAPARTVEPGKASFRLEQRSGAL